MRRNPKIKQGRKQLIEELEADEEGPEVEEEVAGVVSEVAEGEEEEEGSRLLGIKYR